jgi:putative addiction module CopG family antidote
MSIVLPPDLEEFVKHRVSGGDYPSDAEVIREAFRLLERREELLRHIDEGTRQLANGQFTEYDDVSLKQFIDDVKLRGQQRYDAARKRP